MRTRSQTRHTPTPNKHTFTFSHLSRCASRQYHLLVVLHIVVRRFDFLRQALLLLLYACFVGGREFDVAELGIEPLDLGIGVADQLPRALTEEFAKRQVLDPLSEPFNLFETGLHDL